MAAVDPGEGLLQSQYRALLQSFGKRPISALAPGEKHYAIVGPIGTAREEADLEGAGRREATASFHDGFDHVKETFKISRSDVLATQLGGAPIHVELGNSLRLARALDALAGTGSGVTRTSGGLLHVLGRIADEVEAIRLRSPRRR